MSLTSPKDTLAYHLARPLTSHIDNSAVMCANVAKRVKQYPKDQAKPETEAVEFYTMNHGMALISATRAPLEPLPRDELEFVEAYHEMMAKKAVRAFYYLLLICTREARHNLSLNKDGPKIAEKWGKPIADFHLSIKGGESSIHQALLSSPPNATIGAYCEAMEWAFFHSKWNGGYGGAKWGVVNQCLTRFVKGEFTAEMMLDTVWTLAHNGGPIFNKGLQYHHWDQTLYRILDVQRSGQMPEAVMTDHLIKSHSSVDLQKQVKWMKDKWPDKIGSYVDWWTVEALGAVHKYPKDKQQQLKLYGPSEKATQAEKAAAEKAAAAQKAAQEKLAKHAKEWFQILPGVELKKVSRAA